MLISRSKVWLSCPLARLTHRSWRLWQVAKSFLARGYLYAFYCNFVPFRFSILYPGRLLHATNGHAGAHCHAQPYRYGRSCGSSNNRADARPGTHIYVGSYSYGSTDSHLGTYSHSGSGGHRYPGSHTDPCAYGYAPSHCHAYAVATYADSYSSAHGGPYAHTYAMRSGN